MTHTHDFREITRYGHRERHFSCEVCGTEITRRFPDVNPYTGVVTESECSVKPALTAEEWKRKESEVAYLDPGLTVQAEPRDEGYASVNIPDGPARHALAALALYGQPFGFTREDVRACRGDVNAYVEDRDEMLRSLAGRIEALLPPEK